MKKSIFVPVLALILPQVVCAAHISRQQADRIAADFFTSTGAQATMPTPSVIPLQSTAPGTDPLYIYNSPSGHDGFIIISTDDCIGEVLGYSTEGAFDFASAPDGLKALIDLYAGYITNNHKNAISAVEASAPGTPMMTPLTGDITWGQGYPFNTLCPTYSSGTSKVNYYSGCVATAATQIMKYYNYPAHGSGSKSYSKNGISLSADFSQSVYDWDNMPGIMPDTPTDAQVEAASRLAADFGIAVEMEYAPEGSGAYTMLVPTALKEYFGYDSSLRMHSRDYYNTSEWMDMIKGELNAGRPVYYAATSEDRMGGHAFVCDGYDSADYVHINWGWYGRSNGYFMINRLNPGDLGEGGGSGAYNISQEIITGFAPAGTLDAPDLMPVYGGSRLAVIAYSTDITMMSFVLNYDTRPFDGHIGAALVSEDGTVATILSQTTLTIDGFNGRSGSQQVTMRNVPLTANGIPDGTYYLKFAVQQNGSDIWQVVRQPIGLPGYATVSVSGGKIKYEGSNTPEPDVTLIDAITADGSLYAGGCGLFTLHLLNNSPDYRINSVALRLTSLSDGTVTDLDAVEVNIYDLSEATVNLLCDIPSTLAEGTYEVTAYVPGFENKMFDDATSGRGIVEVNPASDGPVLRLTTSPVWQNRDGIQQVAQGEYLTIGLAMRNYGSDGPASVLTRLRPVDDPDRSYVFLQQTKDNCDKGEAFALTFYRQVPVDPGTYNLEVSSVGADGTETRIDTPSDCLIDIDNNPDIVFNVVSFNLPATVVEKVRGTYTMTVMPLKSFSGNIVIRARQFTNKSGEIMTMSRQTLVPGEATTFSFNWSPTVALGKYIILVEAGSNQPLVGGHVNYYLELNVVSAAGIDNITADNSAITLKVEGDMIVADGAQIPSTLAVLSPDGRSVATARNTAILDISSLAPGMYIAVAHTANGQTTLKFAIK